MFERERSAHECVFQIPMTSIHLQPIDPSVFRSVLSSIGRTPLVRLLRVASAVSMPVLAKCEHLNPGGSIKDRIALAIVDDAEARGILSSGMTLVEATAGNTGVGLALVAAARGYGLVLRDAREDVRRQTNPRSRRSERGSS